MKYVDKMGSGRYIRRWDFGWLHVDVCNFHCYQDVHFFEPANALYHSADRSQIFTTSLNHPNRRSGQAFRLTPFPNKPGSVLHWARKRLKMHVRICWGHSMSFLIIFVLFVISDSFGIFFALFEEKQVTKQTDQNISPCGRYRYVYNIISLIL